MTDARLSAQEASILLQPDNVNERLSALEVSVPMLLDTTTIAGRLSAVQASVPMLLNNISAQISGLTVMVVLQIKRGYVTDMSGHPIMAWSGGSRHHVRTLN